jgi:hypothetical protein
MAVGTGTAILGSAALGMLGGSKKSGSSTSTQNSAPWAATQPYWNSLFIRGHQTPYKGGPNLSAPAADQLRSTIQGDYLNPSSNPFFQGSVNDALGLAKSQFAGQYGGQAGGNLGNTGYQEMLMRTLGNVATNAYSDQFNRERQNQIAAAGGAPSFDAASMQAPFAPLREQAAILAGAGGGSSTTSQPFFTNPMAGALGGALAGGQLYGMMGGQSLTNPFSFGGIPGYGG